MELFLNFKSENRWIIFTHLQTKEKKLNFSSLQNYHKHFSFSFLFHCLILKVNFTLFNAKRFKIFFFSFYTSSFRFLISNFLHVILKKRRISHIFFSSFPFLEMTSIFMGISIKKFFFRNKIFLLLFEDAKEFSILASISTNRFI